MSANWWPEDACFGPPARRPLRILMLFPACGRSGAFVFHLKNEFESSWRTERLNNQQACAEGLEPSGPRPRRLPLWGASPDFPLGITPGRWHIRASVWHGRTIHTSWGKCYSCHRIRDGGCHSVFSDNRFIEENINENRRSQNLTCGSRPG